MFLASAIAQTAPLESVAAEIDLSTADQGGNFPPFDSSFFGSHLFWLLLSFSCLYFLMARIIIPRIGSILDLRGSRIASDLEGAAIAKQEADAAMALYEQQLEKAREQAQALTRTAFDEAKESAQNEQAKIEAALSQRLNAAEQHIATLQANALEHVEKIATETAESILLVLTSRKPDKAIITQMVKLAAQNG